MEWNFVFFFKVIPHKACTSDVKSDFSSDETKSAVNTLCIHEAFCEIWRKICKQMTCRAVQAGFVRYCLNSILLGVGLAMDAFSVSLANGLNEMSMI